MSSYVRLVLSSTTTRPPQRLFRLVLETHTGRALRADSEEKRLTASDADTVAVDSLKVLDPKWPIREADISLEQAGPGISDVEAGLPARRAGFLRSG